MTEESGDGGQARRSGAGTLARVGRVLVRALPLVSVFTVLLVGFHRILAAPASRMLGVPGPYSIDADGHLWQYWWTHRAWRAGESLFLTRHIGFPVEMDMRNYWGGHLDLLPGIPLTEWFGVVAAANLVQVLFVLLLATGIYFRAAALTQDRLAGAFAALAYVLSPTVVFEVLNGRVEQLTFGWIALFLLGTGRWILTGRWGYLAGAATCFAVAGVGYLGGLLVTAMALVPLVLGYLLLLGRWGRRDRGGGLRLDGVLWKRVGILVGTLAALTLPFLLYALTRVGSKFAGGGAGPSAQQLQEVQFDWLANVMGNAIPLRSFTSPFRAGGPLGAGYLLVVGGLLPLVGPSRLRRRALPWVAAAAVLMVLTLGPVVITLPGGGKTAFPYEWLARVIPFFSRFHYPNRFMLMGNLCLAVSVAMGLAEAGRWLTARSGWPGVRILATVLACMVILHQVGWLFPYNAIAVRMPAQPLFEQLAEDGARGMLLVHDGGEGTSPEFNQTGHGIPYCCDSMPASQQPEGMRALAAASPLFRFLSWQLHPNLSQHPVGSGWRSKLALELGLEDVAQSCAEQNAVLRRGTPEWDELVAADPGALAVAGFTHVVVLTSRAGGKGLPAVGEEVMLDLLGRHFGEPVIDGESFPVRLRAWRIPQGR